MCIDLQSIPEVASKTMGRPAKPLIVTNRQRNLLEKELRRSNLSQKYIPRIKIILLSSSGESYKRMNVLVKVTDATISFWKKRWIKSTEFLTEATKGPSGQGIEDGTLLSLMMTILDDAERSGAPPQITHQQCKAIQTVACGSPSEYGYPITHWTHIELAIAVVEQGIIDSISPSQVGRILKKQISTPQI